MIGTTDNNAGGSVGRDRGSAGGADGGRVRDATDLNWVDRFAPEPLRAYLRLSRVDRPIGTWLLLIPCFWGIALAAMETGWLWLDLWLFPAAAVGAVLMRGAGCTWNDLRDRDIDAQVARTRSRPLPSGRVSPRGAMVWLATQALAAFCILLSFNGAAFWWGVCSLVPVVLYPFAKRVTHWPQAVLGVAFNWGVPMMYAAHAGGVSPAALCLYAAGIAWTLHYDTIYAHQDREDDALIGVKSTALLFRERTPAFLWLCICAFAGLAAAAILSAGGGWPSLAGAAAMAAFMGWQTRAANIDDAERCLRVFRATRWGGWMLFAGLVVESGV